MSKKNTSKIMSKNLKKLMLNKNLSNVELSKAIGVSASTVGKWILEKSMPRMSTIEKLADFFGISKSELLEENTISKFIKDSSHAYKITDINNNEDFTEIIEDENINYTTFPESYGDADFAMIMSGDSMEGSHIYNNDVLFFKKDVHLNIGDIAVFIINGEAKLGIYHRQGSTVILSAANPKYMPIIINDYNENMFFGKLVGIFRKI